MPHVFISYIRRNRKVVDRLDQELTSRGSEIDTHENLREIEDL